MNSLRETLSTSSTIPQTSTNVINADLAASIIAGIQNETNSVTEESSQSEENLSESELGSTIPSSLIKEQWQLVLGQDAQIPDLEITIERCKNLVLSSNECSEERKWLVRHLVELRFHLKELQDAKDDPNTILIPTGKVILGHHFAVQQITSSLPLPHIRYYCDFCTGIIWSIVQSSYYCTDCGYIVHSKCVDNIVRICAHVIISERKYPISDICPEIGLSAQYYKCAECKTSLNFNFPKTVSCFGSYSSSSQDNRWIEPRLCDYSGLFYCSSCHWNNTSVIPARVVHNWDFSMRKVCRASLQEINLVLEKPIINLEDKNPKLFTFLEKLCSIKKRRANLIFMKKYLTECRIAIEMKLLELQIGSRRHLVQTSDIYCITDLIDAEAGTLIEFLNKIYDTFENHIRNCDICYGKGYICEICTNQTVIFPFDDGCIYCEKCNAIYHCGCWILANSKCRKCIRLEQRRLQLDVDAVADDQQLNFE